MFDDLARSRMQQFRSSTVAIEPPSEHILFITNARASRSSYYAYGPHTEVCRFESQPAQNGFD